MNASTDAPHTYEKVQNNFGVMLLSDSFREKLIWVFLLAEYYLFYSRSGIDIGGQAGSMIGLERRGREGRKVERESDKERQREREKEGRKEQQPQTKDCFAQGHQTLANSLPKMDYILTFQISLY